MVPVAAGINKIRKYLDARSLKFYISVCFGDNNESERMLTEFDRGLWSEMGELIVRRKLDAKSNENMMDSTGSNECAKLLLFVGSPSLHQSKKSRSKADLMWATIPVPFYCHELIPM